MVGAAVPPSVAQAWDDWQDKRNDPEYTRNVLIGLSGGMLLVTLPLLICTWIVASTPGAGFGAVTTGLALFGWEIASVSLMQRGPTALAYGFLEGFSVVMTMATLMTAIFWGQLSQCDSAAEDDQNISQYECTKTGAMKAVCALTVILWLIQLPYVALLFQRRRLIVHSGELESDFAYGNVGDYPSAASPSHVDTMLPGPEGEGALGEGRLTTHGQPAGSTYDL